MPFRQGVPIGLELAKGIPAQMFPVVVRKLKTPRNPKAGFGAMTWNGEIYLNQELVRNLNLTWEEIGRSLHLC